MSIDGNTLFMMALEYIDRKRQTLEDERAEIDRQIAWLIAQRQELLDDSAGQRLKAKYREE